MTQALTGPPSAMRWAAYRRVLQVVILTSAGIGIALSAVAAALAAKGVSLDSWRFAASLMGGVGGIACASAFALQLWCAPRPHPWWTAEQHLRRWRWRRCLYSIPAYVTLIGLWGLWVALSWPMGQRRHVDAYLLLAMPFVLLTNLLPLPGTLQGGPLDRLASPRDREHVGDAFRLGYLTVILGSSGVLAAALFQPSWAAPVLVAVGWLSAIAVSIRFGLLQRAVEGDADEV